MVPGKLIFSPCGSGKSYFINSSHNCFKILDGDLILEKCQIKNRNYFWYEDKTEEQEAIKQALQIELDKGFHVLYSGNPLIWKPDFMVIIDSTLRYDRIMNREGFRPTKEQFLREAQAYSDVSKSIKTVDSFEKLIL